MKESMKKKGNEQRSKGRQ